MAKLIEKVYGDALYELAVEENRTEELLEEVVLIKELLMENSDFAKLMQHPGIPQSEKEKVLLEVWDGKASKEVVGLMMILLKKEHYGQLLQVLDYFISRIKEKEQIGVAYVTSAVSLTEEQKKKVEKRLLETTSYRSLEMHYEIDASLIGGMIIRIGDRVLDNTIKMRLENLSRQLYQIKLQ